MFRDIWNIFKTFNVYTYVTHIAFILVQYVKSKIVELPWRSGSVMDCHVTAPGSIPGRDGVFTELHVLRKGQ